MTISYALRLICVSLAAFAVIFLAAGSLVSLFATRAQRAARRMQPEAGGRFILALRLLPALLATLLVTALCIPSYLRFEQREELEEAGALAIVLAAFSLVLLAASATRAARAWHKSRNPNATLALVGVFRPRIVCSESIRGYLTGAELSLALSHEESHARSRDNLKRLLILLAPGPFPGFRALEQTWKCLAEYAADDRAANGDPARSLSLASALVRMAKLSTQAEPPLVTSFLATGNDLGLRVERLLQPATPKPQRFSWTLLLLLTLPIAAAILSPAISYRTHELLEILLH